MIHILLIFLLVLPLFANDRKEHNSSYTNDAVVFIYHRFGESKYPSTNIKLEQFKYQLNYLQSNNYNIWSLSKIINHIINKKTILEKTVAITIDDAYKSVFDHAYPMLKKRGFPFTVFVNTQAIDDKFKSHVTWEQIRIMQKDGVKFANHSISHDSLLQKNNESDKNWKQRVQDEIIKTQQRLQEKLNPQTNTNPKLFSYPFGEYNLALLNIIKELGYVGVTQLSGPLGKDSNLSVINRFPMSEIYAIKSGFKTKLNTTTLPIKSISTKDPIIKENNPPKLTIELKEPISRIACFLSNGDRLNIKWLSKTKFEIMTNTKLKKPRTHYTCTAPAINGKWYWYSHLWIVK
jgi:peptidoglycan/xylan/chitin deacetylase (PgdA/CDA1 family)